MGIDQKDIDHLYLFNRGRMPEMLAYFNALTEVNLTAYKENDVNMLKHVANLLFQFNEVMEVFDQAIVLEKIKTQVAQREKKQSGYGKKSKNI